MVEHMTVNHMMRVRFPRETKALKLSSIKVIVVVCKTKCMGSIPISALALKFLVQVFISAFVNLVKPLASWWNR
jgi:hypothetical protein